MDPTTDPNSFPTPEMAPPTDPLAHLPPNRPSFAGELFWWFAIVVLAGGIFAMQMFSGKAPEGVPDPSKVSSIELKLTGRMIVGLKSLATQSPSFETQVAGQLDELAVALTVDDPKAIDTPAGFIDRVRAITVVAEVAGAKAAIEELEKVRLDLDALSDVGDFGYDEADTPEHEGEEDLAAFRADLDALETIYSPAAALEAASAESDDAESSDTENSTQQQPQPITTAPSGASELSADQIDQLTDRHGWFGDLALAYGLDESDAARSSIDSEGLRVMVTLIIAVFAGGCLALAGLVLFIIGSVLLAQGTIKSHYAEAQAHFPEPHRAFLAVMPLFLGAFVVVSMGAGYLEMALGIEGISFAAIWLLPLVALYPRLRGASWAQMRAGLGWHTGRGLFREIGSGIVGYVALLPIIGIGLGITLALFAIFSQQASHPIQEQLEIDSVWGAAQLFLLASVWAPLTEETIFRGAFYHHLRQRMGFLVPAIATGFLFAFIHPQGFMAIPVLMALGVNFALLREWRGSIIASMTAHAMHNGAIITLMLLVIA